MSRTDDSMPKGQQKAKAVDAEQRGRRDDIETAYYTCQPNRWTFQSKKIRKWVEQRLEGRVLNACAGRTKLIHDHEIVRNDIDEQRDADFHVDVCEIGEHFPAESFDTIVFDPPFTEYQSNKHYGGQQVGRVSMAKNHFDELLRPGGIVIQFGYTTTCMPMEQGYQRQEAVIWNTLGQMNDYLSTVDKKPGELQAEPRWFK